MTDDEFQRKIDFILEHQARLTVNQERAEERLAGVDERVSRLETAMRELAETQTRMWDVQERMLKAQTHMTEVVAVMADAQRRTDARLNALIGVVERHIGHNHNDHPESK